MSRARGANDIGRVSRAHSELFLRLEDAIDDVVAEVLARHAHEGRVLAGSSVSVLVYDAVVEPGDAEGAHEAFVLDPLRARFGKLSHRCIGVAFALNPADLAAT